MSGDTAFSGHADEFLAAERILLVPLLESLSLPRNKLVLVPGNHDVDRSLVDWDLEEGLRVRLSDRDAANELLCDVARLSNATRRLQPWQNFHEQFYANDPPEELPPLGYLFQAQAGSLGIRVAALNSAWRSASDDDRGKLVVGDQQVRSALSAAAAGDVCVLVCHHPPEWLASWDADNLRRLTGGANVLLLTGHDHVADPVAETSLRGNVLHNRSGCLYETFEYRNGYSLIDIGAERASTVIALRNWYRPRRAFGPAEDGAEGGVLSVDWPKEHSTEMTLRSEVAHSSVMSALTDIVHQRSIISEYLADRGSDLAIEDVLVAPRLWPLPYREAVAIATQSRTKQERVDNRELVETSEVVLVSGDPESGVTGSLLWLLAQRYEASATHLPVYIRFDRHFKETRFMRGLRRELVRYGVSVGREEPLPPLIIAVDDVLPGNRGALDAFARFVKERPEHSYIVGCHGDVYEELAAALGRADISTSVAHVGPFGRRELRTFIEKLNGSPSRDLVDRVMKIVATERLPRNPFVITALVTIILKNIELAEVNESSLLNAYVSFLLGQGETYDQSGSEMDHRRREHLLSMVAISLSDANRVAMPRLELEEFIAKYFRDRGWTDRLSPGRVADDLIRRHILHQSREGTVGFRHPAFRALFSGKAIHESPQFAARLVADPITNEAAIRHAAGLTRNDADLLEAVRNSTQLLFEKAAAGFDVAMFDLIKSKPGWSKDDPDLEALRDRLDVPLPEDPAEEEVDEQVDAYHDTLDFYDDVTEPSAGLHPVDTAWMAARFVGGVLRNSELVDDLDLKTSVVKTVLSDWSIFVVMAAVREDQESVLLEMIMENAERNQGAEPVDRDAVARVVELILVFITVLAVQGSLGTIHLEGTVALALDDDEFMASTAHALFATMLYVAIGAPDWPDRMSALYDRHREHPVVAELVRTYALTMYRLGQLSGSEEPKVEAFLVEAFAGQPQAAPGPVRTVVRSEQRSRAIEQLRGAKRSAQRRKSPSRALDDLLEDEVEESESRE
jgi:hypothetical protein